MEETVGEWSKKPIEGRMGSHSHGIRRKKKGQIKNCFIITVKVKYKGYFLVKQRKNGTTNIRDQRLTERQK